jgi:hypothetical protein
MATWGTVGLTGLRPPPPQLFYWATRLSLPGLSTKILFLGYLSLLTLLNFLLFGACVSPPPP